MLLIFIKLYPAPKLVTAKFAIFFSLAVKAVTWLMAKATKRAKVTPCIVSTCGGICWSAGLWRSFILGWCMYKAVAEIIWVVTKTALISVLLPYFYDNFVLITLHQLNKSIYDKHLTMNYECTFAVIYVPNSFYQCNIEKCILIIGYLIKISAKIIYTVYIITAPHCTVAARNTFNIIEYNL